MDVVARGRAVFDALRRPEEPAEDDAASGLKQPDDQSDPPGERDPEGSPAGGGLDVDEEVTGGDVRAVREADSSETFPGEHGDSAPEADGDETPDDSGSLPSDAQAGPETAPDLPEVAAEAGQEADPNGPRPIQGGEVARSLAGPGRAVGAHRDFPRILAIANQKGGVGKTTTAVNLGASLAELGHRVLVVDLDPQGNATTGLGINARSLEGSVYDVLLHDMPIEDCIEPTSLRNLFAVPATIELAGAEIELVPTFSREMKLRKALESVGDDFDFTVIDCPPSLGLLTVNALAAAGEVVVPIQCEYYALEGLGQLLRNVHLVQGNLNPKLEVSAIILTMHDGRTRLSDQVVREVREHFGDRVCRTVVPRTVRLSEAPSFGQPVIVFDPTSRGALAYRELAKEVAGAAVPRHAEQQKEEV